MTQKQMISFFQEIAISSIRNMKYGLVFILLSFLQLTINAQDEKTEITGIVTEASTGEPVIGATVVISGTTIGTVTDIDGNYSISVQEKDNVLQISFIGFLTESIEINGQTNINVNLVEDLLSLDEVIVIGYGTVKKSDVTGSISSITSESYEEQPVTNVTQALQGRVSGVTITASNGNPGKEAKIRIRGANSLTGDNDPLIVVDGMAINIKLNDINVNDIESMEILKDASATAVFGSRGANGVILITTKKGKSGTSQIQFASNISMSQLGNKMDKLKAPEYMELYNVYHPDSFSEDSVNYFRNNPGAATDWQDEVFRKAYSQDYQLSVRGGSEKITYFLSGGYQDINGIIINSSQKRYSMRSNITAKLNDKLTVDFNLYANHKEGVNNTENGNWGIQAPLSAVIYSPHFAPKSYERNAATGEHDWNMLDPIATTTMNNPVMLLNERHVENITNALIVNGRINYEIIPDLKYSIVVGADYSSTSGGSWSTKWGEAGGDPKASRSAYFGQTMQISNILNYHKTLNSIHDINITAIHEALKATKYNNKSFGTDVNPIYIVQDNNLNVAQIATIDSEKEQNSLLSYAGRANYSLLNRYLVTATFRVDGSSKFPNNKWGYFPSAAVGWKLSDENFLSSATFISNLKLRAGWGITGNQNIPVNSSRSSISSMGHTFGLDQLYPGQKIIGGESPDLKWEKTEQTNIGLDFSAYRDRIGFSFDYYDKNTTDLLNWVSTPAYEGGEKIMKNIGNVNNKGFEISVSGVPVSTKDFSWNINFNFSVFKNKVIQLGAKGDTMQFSNSGGFYQNAVVLANGQPLGTYYLYDHIGFYSPADSAAYVDASDEDQETMVNSTRKVGQDKYRDIDGDGKITGSDRFYAGSSQPDFMWGLNNTFKYKNLSLNVMIQGVKGVEVLNTIYANGASFSGDSKSITLSDGLDYWTRDHQNAKFGIPARGTNQVTSTQWLQDASFVKIRNVSLSYTISRDILKMTDLKLSISGQNLYTFTNYKGFDPESSSSDKNDVDGAIDTGAYPTARTFTFSIVATF